MIPIMRAPNKITNKPNFLDLFGFSLVIKKAINAVQNGSVPGPKAPAFDAGE